MAYHPRLSRKDLGVFITTRTDGSALWFVNNPVLEDGILGELAVCVDRYQSEMYGIAIHGNHIHLVGRFPLGGKSQSDFLRDFNSWVAKSLPRFQPRFPGGSLWARRASTEFLPADEDLEEQFFYTVLQPVLDGLVERISDYPGYNCFSDAVRGIKRPFRVIDWAGYNSDKRWKKGIRIQDYVVVHILEFLRLPGYEHLSQNEYSELMHEKLEARRLEIVTERRAKGLGFLGKEACRKVVPGSRPRSTKTSTRDTPRPRVLSRCAERREELLGWYFGEYFAYRDASKRYREGDWDVEFPEGTFKPPLFVGYRNKPPIYSSA